MFKTKFNWQFIFIVICFSNFLNIGNYSFLSYDYSGAPNGNILFSFIKNARFLILSCVLFYFIIIRWDFFKLLITGNLNLMLYLLLLISSIIFSADVINSLVYGISQMLSLSVLFLFHKFYSRKARLNELINFFRLFFYSNSIVYFLIVISIGRLKIGTINEIAFSSGSFYAYVLLTNLLVILFLRIKLDYSIFEKWKRGRLVEIVIFFVSIFYIFLSARRGPLLVSFLLLFIYIYYTFRTEIIKLFVINSIIAVALFLLIVGFLSTVKSNLSEDVFYVKYNQLIQSNGNILEDESFIQRQQIWEGYNELFEQNPILGVGPGNSTVEYSKRNRIYSDEASFSPHNLFYGIIVEQGLFSLIFFILLFFTRNIKRLISRRYLSGLLFILLPVLFININEFNLLAGQIWFWPTFIFFVFYDI